jgi:hypothetical protein
VPDNKEFRLGAYSGLLAVIMVVALAVMAFVALEPEPMHIAQNDVRVIEGEPHRVQPTP